MGIGPDLPGFFSFMTYTAVVLIIASAVMHAGWNFVSKRQQPSLAFFLATSLSGALLVSPVLVIYRDLLPLIPGSVWVFVAATGVAQAIYYAGLAGAYRQGDISLAYPLVRALPVLFVAVIRLGIGSGGAISVLSLGGMLLIVVGCVLLPMEGFRAFRWRAYLDGVYLMALIAAIGTTAYTLIDDHSLAQLRRLLGAHFSIGQITVLYVSMQISSTALVLGVGTLLIPAEHRQLGVMLRHRSQILLSAVTGLVIMLTYGLVLAAMAYVRDVSYVAAFRQLSIPLGAVLGMTLGGEPHPAPKLAGIGAVVAGLVLVGLG